MTNSYICVTWRSMVYMRKILKSLMDSKGHTGHSLYELSGVPPATTYRFLNGFIGEPRSDTIRKWASVYGVSEAQLRGSEKIDELGVEKPEEPALRLESMLTRDELAAIEGMRTLDKDTRRAWLRIAKELSSKTDKKQEDKTRGRGYHGITRMKYRDPKQGGGQAEAKKA